MAIADLRTVSALVHTDKQPHSHTNKEQRKQVSWFFANNQARREANKQGDTSCRSLHSPHLISSLNRRKKESNMSYDRAITVFSPDGHLLQVEYSMEAVRRGSTVVGIQGADCVILAVEKRAIAKLQDSRTIRKIVSVDNRTVLAFAGLTADARVLINKLRIEAQSYRLTMEDSPSIDYLARYLARVQQGYTQRGGVRPFGIATLMTGVNDDKASEGRPFLYQTDPAGTHSRWKAQVIGGRNSKSLREFLEKQVEEKKDTMTEATCVRMAVQALLEVVDSGAKTMEICVVRRHGNKEMLSEEKIDAVVKEIEAEQQTDAPAASGDE